MDGWIGIKHPLAPPLLVTKTTDGDILETKRDRLVEKQPDFQCHLRFSDVKEKRKQILDW